MAKISVLIEQGKVKTVERSQSMCTLKFGITTSVSSTKISYRKDENGREREIRSGTLLNSRTFRSTEKNMSFIGNSPQLSAGGVFSAVHRIFLISPANLKGVRGQRLLNPRADSELSRCLRTQGAPLADLFCHTSSLYFRGKFTYARHFAAPPAGVEGCYVITSSRGLLRPETVMNIEAVRALAADADIDLEDEVYRGSLRRDAVALENALPLDCQVVLLGSLATEKYVTPLLEIFGRRLFFPSAFVGRGDMSRGGLLLRCIRENRELAYSSAGTHLRRGEQK
jgi:hypothetical protein